MGIQSSAKNFGGTVDITFHKTQLA